MFGDISEGTLEIIIGDIPEGTAGFPGAIFEMVPKLR